MNIFPALATFLHVLLRFLKISMVQRELLVAMADSFWYSQWVQGSRDGPNWVRVPFLKLDKWTHIWHSGSSWGSGSQTGLVQHVGCNYRRAAGSPVDWEPLSRLGPGLGALPRRPVVGHVWLSLMFISVTHPLLIIFVKNIIVWSFLYILFMVFFINRIF